MSTQAVLDAPDAITAAGITALDFDGEPTYEPVVVAWMPAVAAYFLVPDRDLLEVIAMLPGPPKPGRGAVERVAQEPAVTLRH